MQQVSPKLEVWLGVDLLRLQLLHAVQPFVDVAIADVAGSAIAFEDQSGGLTLSIGAVTVLDMRPGAVWPRVFGPSRAHGVSRNSPAADRRSRRAVFGSDVVRGKPCDAREQPRSMRQPSRSGARPRAASEVDGWARLRVAGGGVSEALERVQGARGLRIDAEGRSLRFVVALDSQLQAMLTRGVDHWKREQPIASSRRQGAATSSGTLRIAVGGRLPRLTMGRVSRRPGLKTAPASARSDSHTTSGPPMVHDMHRLCRP